MASVKIQLAQQIDELQALTNKMRIGFNSDIFPTPLSIVERSTEIDSLSRRVIFIARNIKDLAYEFRQEGTAPAETK